MDILIPIGITSMFSIGYITLTGLSIFDNKYKVEDTNKIFFNSLNRKNIYQKYNINNFILAITLLIFKIILFFLVKKRKNIKIHKSIYYVFSLSILLLSSLYYVLIGILTFKLSRMNDNYFSIQSIIDWSYGFILFIFAILVMNYGKKVKKEKVKKNKM